MSTLDATRAELLAEMKTALESEHGRRIFTSSPDKLRQLIYRVRAEQAALGNTEYNNLQISPCREYNGTALLLIKKSETSVSMDDPELEELE